MIKRKKKVNINGNPLEAVTIAEVKNSKFGFIGILILFCLFGAIIYYLPQLEKYYEYYVKGNTNALNNNSNNVVPSENENNEEINEEENDEKKDIYKFGETQSIDLEKIKVSDINFSDKILSFNVTNVDEDDYVFQNYYIELYDNNDKLLQRIMLEGTVIKDEKKNYSFDLSIVPVSFAFKEILAKDYDYIDLNNDENGIGKLVCSNDLEILTYTFKEYKLISVKQEVNYEKNQSDYDSIYTNYKKLVSKYRSLIGFKTSIKEENNNMHYELEIDYETANSRVDDKKFYDKDVDPNVVSFELNAKFYTCK